MQDVVAPVTYIQFDITASLEMQLGALPLPFPGMDSKLLVLFSVGYAYGLSQVMGHKFI